MDYYCLHYRYYYRLGLDHFFLQEGRIKNIIPIQKAKAIAFILLNLQYIINFFKLNNISKLRKRKVANE